MFSVHLFKFSKQSNRFSFQNDKSLSNVHPSSPNRFDLYVDASLAGAKNLQEGQEVRFFAHGDSVFVERFENLSG